MNAHKAVLEGIQAMAARLKPAGDGKPRFMVMRDSLVERDPELAQQKKPTCLEEEPDVYVWKVGPDGKPLDRKSTRLNSSHQIISYAVFCLKKKNKLVLQPWCRPAR